MVQKKAKLMVIFAWEVVNLKSKTLHPKYLNGVKSLICGLFSIFKERGARAFYVLLTENGQTQGF